MRKNEQAKIQYASKYASTANGWKKWIGQIEGIEFSDGIDRKRKLEADFTARIAADPSLWLAYSSVLNDLNIAYTTSEAHQRRCALHLLKLSIMECLGSTL